MNLKFFSYIIEEIILESQKSEKHIMIWSVTETPLYSEVEYYVRKEERKFPFQFSIKYWNYFPMKIYFSNNFRYSSI